MPSSDALLRFLILGFLILFVIMYYITQTRSWREKRLEIQWPPVVQNCPDYWIDKGDGVCENVKNLGKFKTGEDSTFVDFKEIGNHDIFLTDDVVEMRNQLNSDKMLRSKCTWAKQHQVSWEGVHNLCDS